MALQQDQHKGLLKALFWAVPVWALIMALNLDLSDREAYIWVWAKNMDGFHHDGPPMAAWLTAFFTALFGDAPWAVRLPAVIFRLAALGLFVVWAADRWSTSVAKRALWILLGSFFSIASALIAQPEIYFIFFALWAMIEADRRHSMRTGLALGLALLSSWSALGLVPGVIYAFSTRKRGGTRLVGLFICLVVAALWQLPAMFSFGSFYLERPAENLGAAAAAMGILNVLASFVAWGGLTFVAGLLLATWIIARRGLSSPIIGYNRYESVRVPVWGWVLPLISFHLFQATRGHFDYMGMTFVLFPLCGALAATLNFKSREEETSFEWKMLLLALGSMTLLSFAVLQPSIIHLPAFDRGEFSGWKEWVQTDLVDANLVNPNTGYVGANIEITSQVAWALNLRKPQFGALGRQRQFRFWPSALHETYGSYVFFTDDRHNNIDIFTPLCAHPLYWQTRQITLKTIHYSTCHLLP